LKKDAMALKHPSNSQPLADVGGSPDFELAMGPVAAPHQSVHPECATKKRDRVERDLLAAAMGAVAVGTR
jgi:hypothetical protein